MLRDSAAGTIDLGLGVSAFRDFESDLAVYTKYYLPKDLPYLQLCILRLVMSPDESVKCSGNKSCMLCGMICSTLKAMGDLGSC